MTWTASLTMVAGAILLGLWWFVGRNPPPATPILEGQEIYSTAFTIPITGTLHGFRDGLTDLRFEKPIHVRKGQVLLFRDDGVFLDGHRIKTVLNSNPKEN